MIPKTPKLNKIIETKQIFADFAFKDAREKRFGLTPCCKGDVEKYSTVNEICDYEDLATKLNRGDTYKFTTWNHADWIANGDQTDNIMETWIQRFQTDYSDIRLFGINYNNHIEDSTATGAQQIVTIGNSNLNNYDGDYLIRGQSKVYVLVMKDTDAAGIVDSVSPTVMNSDFTNLMEQSQPIPTFSYTSYFSGVMNRPQNFNLFWKPDIKWICCNPGGTVVPAAGAITIPIKHNTGTTPADKNGANNGDFIWFILSRSGEFEDSANPPVPYAPVNGPKNLFSIRGGTTDTRYKVSTSLDYLLMKFATGVASYGFVNLGFHPILDYDESEVRAFTAFNGTSILDDKHAGYNACLNDTETIVVYVKDVLGNVVPNYSLNIDNRTVGKTDKYGMLIHTINNASTNTKHIIDDCNCFVTTGACNQQRIDITVADTVKPSCTNLAIDCL